MARCCVTELTCITCGSHVSRRESGRRPKRRGWFARGAGRWMAFSTSATTWIACGRRGDAKPLADRPRNQWRYAELLPLEPTAVRHDWPVGCTPIVDTPRLAQHLGVRANPAQGRRPQSDRLVQRPVQLGRRRSCAASRREDDRLCVDRQRGQQPGRARGAGRSAGVHFCAAHGAGAEGRAAASVRRDGVCGEVVV